MEYTLGAVCLMAINYAHPSLNPYSNGICSWSDKVIKNMQEFTGS